MRSVWLRIFMRDEVANLVVLRTITKPDTTENPLPTKYKGLKRGRNTLARRARCARRPKARYTSVKDAPGHTTDDRLMGFWTQYPKGISDKFALIIRRTYEKRQNPHQFFRTSSANLLANSHLVRILWTLPVAS